MFFDAVYCINMKESKERRKNMQKRIEDNGVDLGVEFYDAVDGKADEKNIPKWFTAGVGAWGCYKSQLNLLEKSIDEKRRNLLLFEDDTVFRSYEDMTWMESLNTCLEALPDDWDFFYLGGQHLRLNEGKPEYVNRYILRGFNVNRTHAYAINGKAFDLVHSHLLDSEHWKAKHHIDHHYGVLHESKRVNAYTAQPWLCGQDSGYSFISYKTNAIQYWDYMKYSNMFNVTADFSIVGSRVGYGKLGLDGNLGYENKKVSVGDKKVDIWISVHAPSHITFVTQKPMSVFGAVNDDVGDIGPQNFFCDSAVLGQLTKGGTYTSLLEIQPGEHHVRVFSEGSNARAHTVLGFTLL